jgi:amino acid efflux transporter
MQHQIGAASSYGLGRWQALPVAMGSIAGSGILFLPSAVYAEAGGASLLVWLTAALACVPMLMTFDDMVRSRPDSDGIEAFVRAGLGNAVGACVPLLFLALVVVGLPAGAMVSGRYAADALSAPAAEATLFAAALLMAAVAVNLAGVRASVRTQRAGTAAMVVMALLLIATALPNMLTHVDAVEPAAGDLSRALPTAVLAFWAFAGFENLTFLSREFRSPRRDFLPVSTIALTIYGLLTVLLTLAVAARIPRGRVSEVTGLLQLADLARPRSPIVLVVTGIALGATALNSIAWVWGISRLITSAAHRAILPPSLAQTTSGGVPQRAIVLLTGLLGIGTVTLAVFPGIVVDAVAAAGAIFVLLYMLSIISYVRVRGVTTLAGLDLVVLLFLGVALFQSGWRSLYALTALGLAFVVGRCRDRCVRSKKAPAAASLGSRQWSAPPKGVANTSARHIDRRHGRPRHRARAQGEHDAERSGEAGLARPSSDVS